MYTPTIWQDHVTQYENRYRETTNSDGTVTHEPVEGEVIQQGTPQNATNFNHLEDGVGDATELAALLAMERIHVSQSLEDLVGETIKVTLTNNQTYPFNDSLKAISLSRVRNHMDYTLSVEIEGYSGGFPGDIKFSNKLLNGFKVEFTGSAKTVNLKVYVKGGFY